MTSDSGCDMIKFIAGVDGFSQNASSFEHDQELQSKAKPQFGLLCTVQ